MVYRLTGNYDWSWEAGVRPGKTSLYAVVVPVAQGESRAFHPQGHI